MQIQLYKPNKKNTGCAASFQVSQKPGKEPTFYLTLISQHSWDEQKRTGSFAESRKNPDKNVSTKLSEFELGDVINLYNTKTPVSCYHKFNDNSTTINFAAFDKVKKRGDVEVNYVAYGLTVVKNGSQTFKILVEPGEMVRIINLINYFYQRLNDFRQAEFEINLQKRGGTQKSQATEDVSSGADYGDAGF